MLIVGDRHGCVHVYNLHALVDTRLAVDAALAVTCVGGVAPPLKCFHVRDVHARTRTPTDHSSAYTGSRARRSGRWRCDVHARSDARSVRVCAAACHLSSSCYSCAHLITLGRDGRRRVWTMRDDDDFEPTRLSLLDDQPASVGQTRIEWPLGFVDTQLRYVYGLTGVSYQMFY